ncbi:MAG: hypothetical protein ACLRL4_10585 [Bifidobacterium bifidum]
MATLVLALSASVSSMNAGQPGPAASTVSLNAAGKQAAYAAVDDWLANDPLNTAGQIVRLGWCAQGLLVRRAGRGVRHAAYADRAQRGRPLVDGGAER